MHESGIAYDVYVTSKRAAEENHAVTVKTIFVDVGSMAMVNPEQVEFMFRTFISDDPMFAETKLVFNTILPVAECECGYKGPEIFVCPNCGKLPRMIQGREIFVKNLEIETGESS
ncbi:MULTISPECIES: hydrogenase maturation nickel metallochaperone HypA/HybF [Methanocorpusculum]|jgi:hydrogenase nickel incorporation protein HypA/HybF|uniref:hydrogenase maturation nickel metallochaperone HypA/HybF n=1 Tax=Methanocorpusculum TaxID=2192 RepID=UPI0005B29AD5|nr:MULTISPECIES: hydrogenase maturation nickel metallochaperone HypA [Methanocorpusculum]MDD2248502.1 hydrogenase maturation nickel metallochaperone HypA [Methanocorpusculum sp.]MDD2802829.1 hydrogenase maturation nickel metallochaperone HypA [Methanocorpusculum sp.]MDD3046761.1 hydrogenase maturation nickel metallochaperone HypA [Methanocorpusculum sp.]MDD3912287.1 hydrogenase maturation nickel metallochaperone HypA [Methanocorpusculum sp.]MEA5085906.1 hydrogenase maturation nickel metallocha